MWTNCLAWSLAIAVTTSQIFSAPPYNFTVLQVGSINMSGFVGSLIGTFLAPPLSDWMATALARRNKGVYEPEFRLMIMIPYVVLAICGLVAFGTSVTKQEPWPVAVILGFGVFALGTQLGATGIVTYLSDCYRDRAGEAFSVPVAVKNIFTFGMTFYINVFYRASSLTEHIGLDCGFRPTKCFRNYVRDRCRRNRHYYSIVPSPISMLIIRYIYGKRIRSWNHRHGL
jgi:hypothetical protein